MKSTRSHDLRRLSEIGAVSSDSKTPIPEQINSTTIILGSAAVLCRPASPSLTLWHSRSGHTTDPLLRTPAFRPVCPDQGSSTHFRIGSKDPDFY